MVRHTIQQIAAFNQGKIDGKEHGKTVQGHLKSHMAEKESYEKGVNKGKKSYTLKRKSNGKSNRKLGRKYQFVLDEMCENSQEMQDEKTDKVDTMLRDLQKVVNSADEFEKQKNIMDQMMTKAGDDKAKKKKCAHDIMDLVKNYRITGRDDKEDAAATCIKEMNDHIAAHAKTIQDICKKIYQKYIDDQAQLENFLKSMTKPIPEDEIPRIVKAMRNQIKLMDKEDSKADGKTYRKNQRMKKRGTSEAGSEVEDESFSDVEDGSLKSRGTSEAGSEVEDESLEGFHPYQSYEKAHTPRSRKGGK